MGRRLLCRIGWHRWVRRSTEDGSLYRACARCDYVDDRGRPPWIAGGGM